MTDLVGRAKRACGCGQCVPDGEGRCRKHIIMSAMVAAQEATLEQVTRDVVEALSRCRRVGWPDP